jgi:hypothetical protein
MAFRFHCTAIQEQKHGFQQDNSMATFDAANIDDNLLVLGRKDDIVIFT